MPLNSVAKQKDSEVAIRRPGCEYQLCYNLCWPWASGNPPEALFLHLQITDTSLDLAQEGHKGHLTKFHAHEELKIMCSIITKWSVM